MYAVPRVLVSECLEFAACRYDGSKSSSSVVKALEPFVEYVKTCPEMAIGLSSPRESLRLIESTEEPKLVFGKTGEDLTQEMTSFSKGFVKSLGQIHGAILKSRSPSCGTKDVKVYYAHGKSSSMGKGSGLFAKEVLDAYPGYPIEEEGRLTNFEIRESFFYQIFTLAEFDELLTDGTKKKLVAFHTKHKYSMMSYAQSKMTALGRVVANQKKLSIEEQLVAYKEGLIALFEEAPSIGRNINTLTHLYGYFKDDVNELEKDYFFGKLDEYKNHKVPYSVPISILHSWALRFNQEYLLGQSILSPFPAELRDLFDTGNK